MRRFLNKRCETSYIVTWMQLLRNSRSNIDELENVEKRELQNGSPVVVTTWREVVSILAIKQEVWNNLM